MLIVGDWCKCLKRSPFEIISKHQSIDDMRKRNGKMGIQQGTDRRERRGCFHIVTQVRSVNQ